MKRKSEMIIALLAITLVACSNSDDTEATTSLVSVRNITITTEPIIPDLSDSIVFNQSPTRSIAQGSGTVFQVGFQHLDTVGIFPQGGAQIPFALPIEEGQTVSSSNILAQGWSTRTGITYSVYYPYNRYNVESNNDRAVPWDYRKIQHQRTHDTRDHLGKYWFIGANNVSPTINDDGTASFLAVLHIMGAISRVQCIVPAKATYVREMLVADDTLFATHGTFDLFDETGGEVDFSDLYAISIPVTYQPFHALGHTDHITLDIDEPVERDPNDNSNRVLTCYFAVPETNFVDHNMTLYLWDSDGNLYVGNRTATQNNGYLSRNSIRNIAFTNMHATTTLDVQLNDWEKEELCPTCTPVAW